MSPPLSQVDRAAEKAARARQAELTKPAGALGRLEDLACWLAARQGRPIPEPLRPAIAVFAGDHGVTQEGVSAYPSAVTAQMVKNFASGGAAINVLARQIGASLRVIDVGVAGALEDLDGIVHAKVRAGSRNLACEPALTLDEATEALAIGRAEAAAAVRGGANLLIGGEMGIGNTTAAACLIGTFTQVDPERIVGAGTGIDVTARSRKLAIVREAIDRAPAEPASRLAALGGLEIAALVGFFLEAASRGVPALVDGYIATAAALVAEAVEPHTVDWLLASHVSAEQGHRIALEALGLAPIVDLGLRLGEGTGAALAVPLLQAAVALHAEMATFEEAAVSGPGE